MICDNCSYEQASLSFCCLNCKDDLRLPQLDGNDSVSFSSSNSSSSLSLCCFNCEDDLKISHIVDNDSVSSSSNSSSSPVSLLSSLNLSVASVEPVTVYHSSDDLTPNDSENDVIIQLDGNDTIDTDDLNFSSETSSTVDEQTADQYNSVPKIYSANARSLFPKYKDFTEKLINHRLDVVQISETWQDVLKEDHKIKIDELENKHGYKWYSFARKKFRDDGSLTGGGGSAILVNQRNFTSSSIDDIIVPRNVEVVWVKIIPKHKTEVKVFIICGIYSKPNSKTKTILNDHIATNFHLLKMRHEQSRFFFLGDFNDHKPDLILQLSPQLRQTVHHFTYGQKTLDLCITDAHLLYHPPASEPPLLPDDPSSASPSDHSGNLLIPRSQPANKTPRVHKLVTVRPITQSQLNALGNWIVNEEWESVINEEDTDASLEHFTATAFHMLDAVAPVKEVKISCDDPAWMNSRIKTYIRKRNREFDKNRKSCKWKSLKQKCRKLCKEAKNDFAAKFITNLRNKDPRSWMSSMKKLGKANHEKDNDVWHFVNEEKSDQELTDEISHYFAEISGHFTPIDRTLLPCIPFP